MTLPASYSDEWRGRVREQLREHGRELNRLDRKKINAAQAEQIAERVLEQRDRARLATLDRAVVVIAALSSVAGMLHAFGVLA